MTEGNNIVQSIQIFPTEHTEMSLTAPDGWPQVLTIGPLSIQCGQFKGAGADGTVRSFVAYLARLVRIAAGDDEEMPDVSDAQMKLILDSLEADELPASLLEDIREDLRDSIRDGDDIYDELRDAIYEEQMAGVEEDLTDIEISAANALTKIRGY